MHVICRTRQMGKTTDLLELAVEKNYIFICAIHRERERLIKICRDSNNEPPVILTYLDLENNKLKTIDPDSYNGVVVDNVDNFIEYSFDKFGTHRGIIAVAINQDEPDAGNQ